MPWPAGPAPHAKEEGVDPALRGGPTSRLLSPNWGALELCPKWGGGARNHQELGVFTGWPCTVPSAFSTAPRKQQGFENC